MKKLILTLLLLSTHAWSADEIKEISDDELNKKLISTIKDFEVEGALEGSAEFKDCKEQNKFDASLSPTQKESNAQKAVDCIKEKLSKKKNADELAKLSDALGLQSYGLVGSKSTKDITEYFGNKMYKALTGVDRDEKDYKKMAEAMKFKNRKMVDQKVFIQLYRTQLMKNSMFEVSRFCFENFRQADTEGKEVSSTGKSFGEYWIGFFNKHPAPDQSASETDKAAYAKLFTDTGSKGFGTFSDTGSKEAIYQNIFQSLDVNQPDKFKIVETFFMNCAMQIVPLCKIFEADPKNEKTGANACLAKDKTQKYRKAIADAKKIIEGMEKNMDGSSSGMKVADVTFYDPTAEGENSIDSLTNYTSADFVGDGSPKDSQLTKKQDECAQNPENSGCEDFIVVDDSLAKVEHTMDMDLRMKKEVEIARVKALVADDKKKLEEYLTENGYLDLLEKLKKDPNLNIEKEIGNVYEARREAALAELKNKMGSRQMTADQAKEGNKKADAIKANVQESKEERTRLAQVVMFNNIITGYIGLSNKKGETLGRNINVLKKETQGLETANVDSSLFENLKTSVDGESTVKGGLFEDAVILDNILGKSGN
ncbi:hypothetical protein [Peredibacter starrii]|uniref:Uncharacterized protein n=1 Tax=Peredibacter starrii TaxID=28202 RepID=A0AAX4HQZ1_9BACT|nr:hypothetical protein [Peredibacter starrii]WPU65615.1 hypothetical protein SOO65_02525 [Peredibacter starrii]